MSKIETMVKLDPKEYGLEESNVATIEQAFQPKITERDGYAVIYGQLIAKELTPSVCREARELRLKLVKTRTGIAEVHKSQKAFFLAAGKFVDAWKNKETLPVEQMEESLIEIETHFEKIEAKRVAAIGLVRFEKARLFSDEIKLDQVTSMTDQMFEIVLAGLEKAYNDRIEAEAKAEAERVAKIEAERIERERVILENIQLKKEADEKEAALKIEREKAEADRKAIELKAAEERKEAAEKLRIEQEAAKIEREKQAAEIASLQRIAKEKADKEAADALKIANELKVKQAEDRKNAMASDKVKLTKWVDSMIIETLLTDNLKPESLATINVISAKFEGFKAWAVAQVNSIN